MTCNISTKANQFGATIMDFVFCPFNSNTVRSQVRGEGGEQDVRARGCHGRIILRQAPFRASIGVGIIGRF